MDKDWTPPTLHDLEQLLQKDKGCTPPPNLHDLERLPNGQGWTSQPFTIWSGSPMDKDCLHDSTRPASGHGLGGLDRQIHDRALRQNVPQRKLQSLFGQALGPPSRRALEHISKSTGSPSTDRNINDRALRPRMYPNANPKFCLDGDSRPKIDKSMTGPFDPERTPTQTSNFVWTSIEASKQSNV